GWIQTFETDQHTLATTAFHQIEKLFIVCRVNAGLPDPTDAKRNQRAKKRLCLWKVGSDVIIHKKEELFAVFDRRYFRKNFIDRATGLSGREKCLDGSKVAFEMASTSCLYQTDR